MSLTRIEVFLSRNDIEGKDMNVHVNIGDGGHGRAPVGGLLVRNGTFAWPVTVSVFSLLVLLLQMLFFMQQVVWKIRGKRGERSFLAVLKHLSADVPGRDRRGRGSGWRGRD